MELQAQPEQEQAYPQEGKKSGRWTMDEHFRFLEALQRFGKEWKRVQQHVGTRSSTQARSHAQKFFVKLDRRNQSLDNFLSSLDLEKVRQRMLEAGSNQDYEDLDNYSVGPVKFGHNIAAPQAKTPQTGPSEQLESKLIRQLSQATVPSVGSLALTG